jgi:hypothetical protein
MKKRYLLVFFLGMILAAIIILVFTILMFLYSAYTPIENLQLASKDISGKAITGVWKVENKSHSFLQNPEMIRGWKDMRLSIYPNNRFKLENIIKEYATLLINPPLHNSTIVEGNWEIISNDVTYSIDNGSASTIKRGTYTTLILSGDNGISLRGNIVLLDTERGVVINWIPIEDEIHISGDKWIRVKDL